MDPFKRNLYAEFESNCFKLLGVPSSRVREVFADRKTDINAKFEGAWDFGGAPFMRQEMSMTIAVLELVYHETERYINFKDYDKYLHIINKSDYKRHILYEELAI